MPRKHWGPPAFGSTPHRPAEDENVFWVGAGTRDTGFSLTKLSFQITHATDSDTNTERDYIIAELMKHRGDWRRATPINPANPWQPRHVNHYITDGEVTLLVSSGTRQELSAWNAPMPRETGASSKSLVMGYEVDLGRHYSAAAPAFRQGVQAGLSGTVPCRIPCRDNLDPLPLEQILRRMCCVCRSFM